MRLKVVPAIIVILTLPFLATFPMTHAAGIVVLITEEEAAAEDMPEAMEFDMPEGLAPRLSVEKTIQDSGPKIIVREPEPAEQHMSPISLIIDFFPRAGTGVDLTKLKLEFLKLIPINVTNRVRDYLSESGIRAEEVKIPAGRFKIRITLGDTEGGITQQVFGITIVK